MLGSAFSASAGSPSGPAALLFFSVLIAATTSSFVGGPSVTGSACSGGGIAAGVSGGGRLRTSSKCSAHRARCDVSVVRTLTILS
ncbi:hypothetical protein [Acinetobacter baumannii]|uniref:hypothetical protein n=1 Tax=Acinetobacter baumannii TaxID=470 RepID=UPI003392C603